MRMAGKLKPAEATPTRTPVVEIRLSSMPYVRLRTMKGSLSHDVDMLCPDYYLVLSFFLDLDAGLGLGLVAAGLRGRPPALDAVAVPNISSTLTMI